MTPQTQADLSVLRQKMLDGTITLEELRAAVKLMRADRVSASTTTSTRRAKVKATIKSADEMLDELGSL